MIDHEAERALCRKFDFRLLPILAFMCMSILFLVGRLVLIHRLDLCNALDKGNLGNAKTDGMDKGEIFFPLSSFHDYS